jgi:hypothetical protein
MTVRESDLDYLDKWLSSDMSPPKSMMLSDLDGFLMPADHARWVAAVVWGGGCAARKAFSGGKAGGESGHMIVLTGLAGSAGCALRIW